MHNVFILAITLAGVSVLCAQTESSYQVTVSDVKTTPSADNGALGVKEDVFLVKFKATLHNTTDHAVFTSVDTSSFKSEILLPSGEWKTMSAFDLFDTGDKKYQKCTRVEPRKTFAFPNVTGLVVLGRDRPARSTATVRFYFDNVCLVGSATHSTSFLTEPIEINH